MTNQTACLAVMAVLVGRAIVSGQVAPPPEASATTRAETVVRATENAFAATMAARDAGAFARFLDREAVFFGGTGAPRRGAAAVADGWLRYFDGAVAPFAWRADRVAVLDSGRLALSSGPVFDAGGHRVSTFNSVWRRGADDEWRIVFDIGCPAAPQAPAGSTGAAVTETSRPISPVSVDEWPEPKGHYSPAVVANGFAFVSGQLPVDPTSGAPRADLSVRDQTLLALRNLEAVLRAAGSSRERVTKATVFVADAHSWEAVDAAYAEFFGAHRPARSVVPVGRLHHGVAVEVEAIALVR